MDMDRLQVLVHALSNASRQLPFIGEEYLEAIRDSAESLRNSDPAQDSMFDTYNSRADESGTINAEQAKSLDFSSHILYRRGQMADVAGISWLIDNPELLQAIVDLVDAQHDYHERLVAKYTEYCRQYREQQDEIARRDQERTQLITDLPEEIAALKAELEAMKRKK